MAAQVLSTTIRAAIEKSYLTGIPIENTLVSKAQAERIRLCQKVAARLAQNPLMDKYKLLVYGFGRSPKQAYLDMVYIDYIFNLQYSDTDRKKAKYVADHYAKRLIRIGEQTGDWKPIDKGLKHYEVIHGLDREAPLDDPTQNTAELPAVFTTDIKDIDPDRKRISDEERRKLLEAWGATEDQFASAVEREKAAIRDKNNAVYVEEENGKAVSD